MRVRSYFAPAVVLLLLAAAYLSCISHVFAGDLKCCEKHIPEHSPPPVLHVEHERNRDGLLAALTGGMVYLFINRHRHHHQHPPAPTCEDRVERVMKSCQEK